MLLLWCLHRIFPRKLSGMWCFPPSQDDPHFSLHPEEIRDSLWQGRCRDALQALGAPLSWGIHPAPLGELASFPGPLLCFKPGLPAERSSWGLAGTLKEGKAVPEQTLAIREPLWADKDVLAHQEAAEPPPSSDSETLFYLLVDPVWSCCAGSLLCKCSCCSEPGRIPAALKPWLEKKGSCLFAMIVLMCLFLKSYGKK